MEWIDVKDEVKPITHKGEDNIAVSAKYPVTVKEFSGWMEGYYYEFPNGEAAWVANGFTVTGWFDLPEPTKRG